MVVLQGLKQAEEAKPRQYDLHIPVSISRDPFFLILERVRNSTLFRKTMDRAYNILY
jgi:hypothetical protein